MAAITNTTPIYMDDMKQLSCDTVVTDVGADQRGAYVCVQETVFCPHGGGQKADTGFIGDIPIFDARKEGSHTEFRVKHYFDGSEDTFSEGQEVAIRVDALVRMRNARLHSAGHLIGSMVMSEFPGTSVKRTEHFPDNAYMSFQGDLPTVEDVETFLADNLAAVIERDGEVIVDRDGDMRIIQMEGYDRVPCGGTHTTSLSEIGVVDITNVKIKKKTLTVKYTIVED